MFEKEIKFIIDFTLNRVNKLGSFFPYERLASAEIHPAILLYISAHLDYLIYEDRRRLMQNSSFDYSGSEISHYFNLISEEIKKNKRLAFEDVRTLVTHAVTFNINYLVRPNWTLSKLIFDENKTKNVNEIKRMLNYIYYYDYVKNVFYGYFSKRKILSLSETEFGMILGKIDQQMFSEHTHDLIDNALVSIGDFFNEGGINKTRIHTQTVELFLKEKDLMEPLFKLRRAIPADDKRKYDIEEIRKILYSKEPLKTSPAAKEEESETEEIQTSESENPSEKEQQDYEVSSDAGVSDVNPSEEKETEAVETEEHPSDNNILNEPETEKEAPELPADKSKEAEKSGEGISEQVNEQKEIELESSDDFLSRYKTELKSLEELEAQLDTLSSEDDLNFTELDEDDEEPVEENTEVPEEIETDSTSLEEKPPRETSVPEDTLEDIPEDTPEDEIISEELIIEEEELSFDDDESNEQVESETLAAADRKNNDILSFLSDKEMEKIVANVFNEDEEDFVNTMEKISESADYDEATEILKAVFFSYKVSPYSRDAVVLTNAVSNFFNQD